MVRVVPDNVAPGISLGVASFVMYTNPLFVESVIKPPPPVGLSLIPYGSPKLLHCCTSTVLSVITVL